MTIQVKEERETHPMDSSTDESNLLAHEISMNIVRDEIYSLIRSRDSLLNELEHMALQWRVDDDAETFPMCIFEENNNTSSSSDLNHDYQSELKDNTMVPLCDRLQVDMKQNEVVKGMDRQNHVEQVSHFSNFYENQCCLFNSRSSLHVYEGDTLTTSDMF